MEKDKESIIGRVLATEKVPTTIDNFAFWTNSNFILNPFDIVKVSHLDGSYTYGVVENISHITDAASFLTNYISSDFGNTSIDEPTIRVGMNYVQASVVGNTKNIYLPVHNNARVYLATKEEIEEALGLKNIKNPLCCGYLEMYNGNKSTTPITLKVNMNSKFLIGPEGAHLNISGISGLAAKTSYAMFLMKSIQETYMNTADEEESVAFVLFNVKGRDLLAIDKPNDFSDFPDPKAKEADVFKAYTELGLSTEPFKHVHYYYPGNEPGFPKNTYLDEEMLKDNFKLKKAKYFKYTYEEDRESLDLMFSAIEDPNQTMESILNYILTGQGEFRYVEDWQDLLDKVKNQMSSSSTKEISVASWRKFYRIINKEINDRSGIFATRVAGTNETRLGDALKHIKKNEIHVIDIAKMTEDKQSFIFGDALRTIYNLKLGAYSEDDTVKPPSRIIIFIDELNKYAGKDAPKSSPILNTILDVTERGRSLGVVLFGAEQFRSAIKDRVTGNCSTHAYGRTNTIEINQADYRGVPQVYKNMLTRLSQGEYIVQNPVFRSVLRIKFPLPIYKQFKN